MGRKPTFSLLGSRPQGEGGEGSHICWVLTDRLLAGGYFQAISCSDPWDSPVKWAQKGLVTECESRTRSTAVTERVLPRVRIHPSLLLLGVARARGDAGPMARGPFAQ